MVPSLAVVVVVVVIAVVSVAVAVVVGVVVMVVSKCEYRGGLSKPQNVTNKHRARPTDSIP